MRENGVREDGMSGVREEGERERGWSERLGWEIEWSERVG